MWFLIVTHKNHFVFFPAPVRIAVGLQTRLYKAWGFWIISEVCTACSNTHLLNIFPGIIALWFAYQAMQIKQTNIFPIKY